VHRNPATRRNVLLVLAVLALAYLMLGGPTRALLRVRQSGVGRVVLAHADSATTVAGTREALLARDSLTLLIVIDPSDEGTRAQAHAYGRLTRWAQAQKLSRRVLVRGDLPAATAFARLGGLGPRTMLLEQPLAVRLDLPELPATVLVDTAGAVRGRWLGKAPKHLEVLNVLLAVEH
jgi:hypothetical protein